MEVVIYNSSPGRLPCFIVALLILIPKVSAGDTGWVKSIDRQTVQAARHVNRGH
jgi:hypothetical protein